MTGYFLITAYSALLSVMGVTVFNRLDENAFCDYDEIQLQKPVKDPRLTMQDGLGIFLYICICDCTVYAHGKSIWAVCLLALAFATLLLITISDNKYFIIPDEFLSMLFFTGLIFVLFDVLTKSGYLHQNFFSPLWGGLVGGGVPYLLGWLAGILLKKDSLGFGDVKLFAIVGFFVGLKGILAVFFISVVMAGLYCGVLLIFKKMTFSSMIAFGPFICGAMTVYLCFSQEIMQFVSWYGSLFTSI